LNHRKGRGIEAENIDWDEILEHESGL